MNEETGTPMTPPPTPPSPPQYQPPASSTVPPGAKSKVVAGVLGILLGAFGVHKFYLGFTAPGLIMLLVTVLTFGLASPVTSVIGLVEGILYLTKSDEEFYQMYEVGKKQWF